MNSDESKHLTYGFIRAADRQVLYLYLGSTVFSEENNEHKYCDSGANVCLNVCRPHLKHCIYMSYLIIPPGGTAIHPTADQAICCCQIRFDAALVFCSFFLLLTCDERQHILCFGQQFSGLRKKKQRLHPNSTRSRTDKKIYF